uniref:SfiI-subtelomeric related protein family member, putative n=1 Tax=Theileria annulata TaxID=5874 RepID=A0A3B0MU17_THEAN
MYSVQVESYKSVETSIPCINNIIKIKKQNEPKLVELNIDNPKLTPEYKYIYKDGKVEYITMSDYAFNKVTKGKKVIWESQNNEFGSKVLISSYNNEEYVTIFFTRKNFKVFKTCGKEIYEISTDINSHSKLHTFDEICSNCQINSSIKLYTEDNEGKNVLMPIDMYNVEYNEDFGIYTFKRDSKCSMIKFENCVIWECEKK